MADKKITELNLHTSPELSDIIPIVNNSETKKTTYGSLYYGIREGLATTGSNTFIGTQKIETPDPATNFTAIDFRNTTNFGIYGKSNSIEARGNTLEFTATDYGINGDVVTHEVLTLRPEGRVGIGTTNPSTKVEIIGDQTISGSLFISGTTELGGNIVPKTAEGATLGTSERPFSDIFVSSGSINIASDTPGAPNTTLTNIGGNILVSAGGMRLVGDASFIAATGSFQYLSGSFTHIGSAFRTGDTVIVGNTITTGSLQVSGSTTQIGNNTLIGNTQLSGSVDISGSLYLNGNRQFNYGQFSDLTTQSGSADTAYAMKLNTTDLAVGFSIVDGTKITATHTGIYNLQFSTQLEQTTNHAAEVSIWIRKNGTDVPNSNTELTIEKIGGGGKMVAAWNYIIQLNSNQYVELMWTSTRSDTQLHFHDVQSTPTRPKTPSVIVTMTQIA